MSVFFNGSLLDEFVLSKEKFETVVGLGSSKAEIKKIFCLPLLNYAGQLPSEFSDFDELLSDNSKHLDYLLDKWCREQYGVPFDTVYHLLQSMTLKKFEDCMLDLGIRGNPSAIAIMNEVIRKKENNGLVQVNFVNQLPEELEEDKEDDI